MPLIADKAAFQKSLRHPFARDLPAWRDRDRRWFEDRPATILRKGTVAVVKEDTEIAKVTEPGAVFGELSVLLISRTQQTCVPWKLRSFTWPTRTRFSHKIRSRCFMLPPFWHTISSAGPNHALLFN